LRAERLDCEADMSYSYRLRIDNVTDENKIYTVYGIEAVGESGEVLAAFSDVFFDIEDARAFVGMCNRLKLSLIHLADAVDDVLAKICSGEI